MKADKSVGLHGQLLHAGLVAQYRALAAFAAGVDGQHGQFAALA